MSKNKKVNALSIDERLAKAIHTKNVINITIGELTDIKFNTGKTLGLVTSIYDSKADEILVKDLSAAISYYRSAKEKELEALLP